MLWLTGSCRPSAGEMDLTDVRLEWDTDTLREVTPMSAWLCDALLRPDDAMAVLRSYTRDGKIYRQDFPVTYTLPEWGAAAWEVYCATGSEEWLREAYGVILATIRAERSIALTDKGLVKGIDPHLDAIYPRWLSETGRMESPSLWVNVFHFRSLDVAALMARRLGRPEAGQIEARADEMREAVNARYWTPVRSRYAAMLYGPYYPIQGPTADVAANAVCAITGLATPEMSAALLRSIPASAKGYADFYPAVTADSTAPTPLSNILMAIAAARVRDSKALRAACAALSGRADAVILKAIYGLRLTPDGIEVAPFVPKEIKVPAETAEFRYRDATITLRLQGTGDRIASFKIDSVSAKPFIPATLSGSHVVEVVMASNTLPAPLPVRNAPGADAVLPEAPTPSYNIYVNGVLERNDSQEPARPVPVGDVVDVCPVSEDGTEGFSLTPMINPHSIISVPATTVTPRRPPLNLIKDSETAWKYIELAPRHNTRLTFYVNVPRSGKYDVRIAYSNGSTATAVRTLGVMGTDGADIHVGQIVCPPVRRMDWITTALSTGTEVTLAEGSNRLSITYVTGTILLNRIDLFEKK